MIPWWVIAVLVVGFNVTIWAVVGALRLLEERAASIGPRLRCLAGLEHRPGATSTVGATSTARGAWVSSPGASARRRPTPDEVAVLMAAHNEEAVIEDSLRSVARVVPMRHVHVVSDGSTDRTAELARRAGAEVTELAASRGKASALRHGISRFGLVNRFRAVVLVDADTRLDPDYLTASLPLFDDRRVVAVAGCVRTNQPPSGLTAVGRILTGHRERIYALTQRLLKFGQTWRRTNATLIVPGFASMYRTDVLPLMDIDPRGLVIEDFNMTFEVYQKQLGRVAFCFRSLASTQDPDRFRDYVRQTKRWSLGLWQTVRRQQPRWNLFTVAAVFLLTELLASSLMFVMMAFGTVVLAVPEVFPSALDLAAYRATYETVADRISLEAVLYGVLIPDLSLTALVAIIDRRVGLLLCGPFFPFLRVLDAAIALYALPLAWLSRSSGRWRSPARRPALQPDPVHRVAMPGQLADVVPSGEVLSGEVPSGEVVLVDRPGGRSREQPADQLQL